MNSSRRTDLGQPSTKDGSLFIPGRNCWRIESADRAAFLIDAQAYFSAFVKAAEKAVHSIFIVGWDMDSRIRLVRDGSESGHPAFLGDFLESLVKTRDRLHVHMLGWDYPAIFSFERELFPVLKFDRLRHDRLHFRLDASHPVGASFHQKVVVIDDKVAFVGGIDLAKGRWDTPSHTPRHPERVDPFGNPYPPVHDVQMLVEGKAAAALGDLVRSRWRRAVKETLSPPPAAGHDAWPDGVAADFGSVRVAISRTLPAMDGGQTVREIERLYLDSIRAARRLIYIENQYLTAQSVGSAIRKRLQEADGPRIIAVLPRKSASLLEETTMGVFTARFLKQLKKNDPFGHLLVVFPHRIDLDHEIINVHSKVMVVDDFLVHVGSSNLDNRSMGVDAECDLAIESAGKRDIARTISRFRDRLLAEHLGRPLEEIETVAADPGRLMEFIRQTSEESRSLKPVEISDLGWLEDFLPQEALFDPQEPLDPEAFSREFMPVHRTAKGKRLERFVLVLLSLLAVAAAWRFTPLGDLLDVQHLAGLKAYLRETPFAGFLVMAVYVSANLLVVPILFLILGTAYVFEPLQALWMALAGTLSSALSMYAAGRCLGKKRVGRLAGARLTRLTHRLRHHGLLTIIVVRNLPVAPFTVVNLVAGAMRVGLFDFTLGTLIGLLPGIVAITLFEKQLERVLQHPDTANVLVLFLLVFVLAAAALGLRKWLQNRDDQRSGGRS